MLAMKVVNLAGAIAPLTTPFAPDGTVSLARFQENITRYNKTGLAGYTITGSTGESVLLRWEEVYRLWQTAKEAAAPGKVLIAGAGAEATDETIEHARRAAEIGYDAVLIRTPSFYKPAISDEMLAAHYLKVADASRIPVLVYSVPVFTHVKVEASLIPRVASHPNIIGMKDSSGDVEGVAKIIAAATKGFQLLCGSAATLYQSLKVGAVGAVVSPSCVFPELCAEVCEAARARDYARAEAQQQKLIAPARLFAQVGISGLKYALDQLGYYGGAPRLPLLPPDEAVRRSVDVVISEVVSQPAA